MKKQFKVTVICGSGGIEDNFYAPLDRPLQVNVTDGVLTIGENFDLLASYAVGYWLSVRRTEVEDPNL